MRIHLNIGSNQGDREALIARAVALIADAFPGARITCSPCIETEPWGYESTHPFLNRGVMIDTQTVLSPEHVLDITQEIEQRIGHGAPHRNHDGTYCDRPIDIDIIDIDRIILHTAQLTLPHPKAHLRPFVMVPLRHLDPATADSLASRDC